MLDTLDEKASLFVDWNEMYEKLVEVPWHSIQMMQNYLLDKELIYQQIWLSAGEKQIV